MNSVQVFINERPVDFNPSDVRIRFNHVVSEANNLSRKGGTVSFTISFPKTVNNNITFGNIDNKDLVDTFNRGQDLNIVILSEGEVVLTGLFLIRNIGSSYNGIAISNAISWVDLIKNKTLQDITSFSDAPFDPAGPNDISSYQAGDITSQDIQFALIAYGNFPDPAAADNYVSNEITSIAVDDYVPSFYYLNVIKKVFEDIGFNIGGGIMEDATQKELIMPFVGDEPFVWNWNTLFDLDTQIDADGTGNPVGFSETDNNPDYFGAVTSLTQGTGGPLINQVYQRVVVRKSGTYRITHHIQEAGNISANDILLTFYEPDQSTKKFEFSLGNSDYTVATVNADIDVTVELNVGDMIESFWDHPQTGADLVQSRITVQMPEESADIEIAKNLPAIDQRAFIQDFIRLNNLFPLHVDDSRTVILLTEAEFKKDAAFQVDITSVTDRGSEKKIPIQVYEKIKFKYSNQSDDAFLSQDIEFGNDENTYDLPRSEGTLTVGSLFSATKYRTYQLLAPVNVEQSLPLISRDVNEPLNEVSWVFDHTPRLLRYTGVTGNQIVVSGSNEDVGGSEFPDSLKWSTNKLKYKQTQNERGVLYQYSSFLTPFMFNRLRSGYLARLGGSVYRVKSLRGYDPFGVSPTTIILELEVN